MKQFDINDSITFVFNDVIKIKGWIYGEETVMADGITKAYPIITVGGCKKIVKESDLILSKRNKK